MSKKTVVARCVLGFPIGISIGYIITIIISLVLNTGEYLPCVPAFAERFGNELTAVVVQTVLCGVIGSAYSGASVIWETETWSIAKQTGLYFLITSVVSLPIAYFAEWMQHSLSGFAIYFGAFVGAFAVIWIVQYAVLKIKIRHMNRKISAEKE
ncbi:MAG: DUF3021 domain-containing protein [Oscillospiraceae bacterium]|nr:DUF3021 domain-containing protein [Oscillospiraceae bacterium]